MRILPSVLKARLEEANMEMPINGMMELFNKHAVSEGVAVNPLSARELINMSYEHLKREDLHGLDKTDAMLLKKAMIPFAFAVVPWKKW